MLRSPVSDVEIPDVPLTDFVFARAAQLGQKPALIDAPTGRTITYAELAESVRAGAAGPAGRGVGKGGGFAPFAPHVPEDARPFPPGATGGGGHTTPNPPLAAEGVAGPLG